MIELDDSSPKVDHNDGCDCGCDHGDGFIEIDNSAPGDSSESTDDENGFLEL